jgi:2'-5' RNA ligase
MNDANPRPLYLMVKPPRAVAERMALNRRAIRPLDLLHMTLLPLGDRRDYSDAALAGLIASLDRLQLFAFRLVFDWVHESAKTVALRGSEPIEGALAFQGALRATLARDGIVIRGYDFGPHITLAYRRDGLGNGAILPISWRVEDFCLVESVYGEGRHIEHARFPLLLQESLPITA